MDINFPYLSFSKRLAVNYPLSDFSVIRIILIKLMALAFISWKRYYEMIEKSWLLGYLFMKRIIAIKRMRSLKISRDGNIIHINPKFAWTDMNLIPTRVADYWETGRLKTKFLFTFAKTILLWTRHKHE